MEPHCFLFMDETAHGYTFLNVGTLQELEEAGRQRFAKCTVLPAVYFGEKTRATPQVRQLPGGEAAPRCRLVGKIGWHAAPSPTRSRTTGRREQLDRF